MRVQHVDLMSLQVVSNFPECAKLSCLRQLEGVHVETIVSQIVSRLPQIFEGRKVQLKRIAVVEASVVDQQSFQSTGEQRHTEMADS